MHLYEETHKVYYVSGSTVLNEPDLIHYLNRKCGCQECVLKSEHSILEELCCFADHGILASFYH